MSTAQLQLQHSTGCCCFVFFVHACKHPS
jgi:hypothetical protein